MTESVEKKGGFHYAYLIVLSGIVICCFPCSMVLNCAGQFFTPLASYFNVPTASASLYLSILSLVMAVALPFEGKLLSKMDLRVVLSACVIIDGVTMIGLSFISQIWMLYVGAVLAGIGTAPLVYLSVPTLINAWCRSRVGFFTGLCMAFTGIGAAIFNPIAQGFMAAGPEGWRTAYLVFGIVILVATLPFTLFVIRTSPADKGLLPYGAEAVPADSGNAAAKAPAMTGTSAAQAMKTPAFYAVALFCGLITLNQTVFQFLPTYVNNLAVDFPELLLYVGLVSSACMIGQALGKVILGAVNDKSAKGGMALGIGAGIVGVLLMMFLGFQYIALLVGSFLFGFVYACTTVQSPLLTRTVFGSKDYTSIYSRVSMVGTFCSAIASVLWGIIVDLPNGFNLMFILSIAVMVVSFLLGMFALGQNAKHHYSEQQ